MTALLDKDGNAIGGTTATKLKAKLKDPDAVAGNLIRISCRVTQAAIIAMNIAPYAGLIHDLTSRVFGRDFPTFADAGVGFLILVGIQAAELRPLFMHRPTPEALERTEEIANRAYAIDLTLGFLAWPPLRVSLERFIMAGSWRDLDMWNIAMIIAITFGVSALEKTIQKTR